MIGSPLKIGVLASHGGSNMQAILDGIAAGEIAAEAVVIISNNSQSGAAARAEKAGVRFMHISGQTHPGDGVEDQAIHDALVDAGAELIILAGYMKKIGPVTLARFGGRILNIHPALLPRHGGAGMYGIHPHEAAIAAGDAESGATVHAINSEYDRGPAIRQERVPVLADDTPQTLQQRVLAVEHKIYPAVVKDIADGKIALPIKAG